MAEIREKVNCFYCGGINTISVIYKQTTSSRSIKTTRCTECKKQSGIYEILNRKNK